MANSRLWIAASAIQIAANKVMHASCAGKTTPAVKDATDQLGEAVSNFGKLMDGTDADRFCSDEEAPRIPKARGVPTIFKPGPAAPAAKTRDQILAEIAALEGQLGA